MPAQSVVPIAAPSPSDVDFESAFERAPPPLSIFRVGPGDIVLVRANAAARAELGLAGGDVTSGGVAASSVTSNAVIGRRIEDLFLTAPALALASALRRAAEFGRPTRVTLQSFGRTAGSRCEAVATPVAAGGPSDLVLLALTARPVRGLRASAVTLDQLEALGDGQIFVFDIRRRRVRYLAAGLAQMIGHAMDAPLDLAALRALIHPDDFEAVAAYFTNLGPMGAAAVSSVTLRIARPEGGWRWLEARGRALTFEPDGAPRIVLGVAIDITERRAMSRALDRATRAVLRAGDLERRRFARNLHDSTAQHLVAIDLALSSLERRVAPGAEIGAILRDIRVSLSAAHREVRTYSYLLHPPQLQRLGLEGALRRLAEGFGRRAELTIDIEVAGAPQAVSAEMELAMFRVAQEAIMNVHRHAHANRATVRLIRSPASIVLEVEDDGVGLQGLVELSGALDASRAEGVGIPGMQARMAQLGGSLELLRRERGVCVRAELPLWVNAE